MRVGRRLFRQCAHVHPFAMRGGSAGLARTEDPFDGLHEPVAVIEHDFIELPACGVGDRSLPCLQGLQVEADGGDGRLQLMRH